MEHVFDKPRVLWLAVAAGGLWIFVLALRDAPAPVAREAPVAEQAAREAPRRTPRATVTSAPTPRARVVHTAEVAPPSLHALVHEPEETLRRMAEAEEVAIASCMRERGFEYAEMPYVSGDELRIGRPTAGDVEAATRQGYGFVALRGEQEFPEADPNEALRAKMPPEQEQAWRQALQGQRVDESPDENFARVETPDGTLVWDKRSCYARGRQALHGDDEGNYALELRIQELRAQARDEAQRAVSYQQPLRAWRACMAQRGHDFASPDAARDTVSEQLEGIADPERALAREVAVAKDDAECDQRVGLRQALERATEDSERALEAENPETLFAMAEQRQDTLARADQLLQGRGEDE